jgi:hypothetical protein
MLCQRYIAEEDAVREVLMALQGRINLLLTWRNGTGEEAVFVVSPLCILRMLNPTIVYQACA